MDLPTILPPIARSVSVDATSWGGATGWGTNTSSAEARINHLAHLYSMEYWETIGGVLGVLTVVHAVTLLPDRRAARNRSSSTDAERARTQPSSSFLSRIWRASKSLVNILLYRIPIPLRFIHNLGNLAEALCVSAYLGVCIAWSLMNTDVRVASNWSSRAGLMAATQVPFVIALAGKNNLISYLTGLSYEKLNVIHRAAGRTLFIVAWTHFGGMLWSFVDVYHVSPFMDPQHRWGLAALFCLTVVTLSSVRAIRNRSYELFLILHITLIIVFILSILFHAPHMRAYVWPDVELWGLDRLARLLRLVFLNNRWSASVSKPASDCIIERLSSDTVRLSLRRPRNYLSCWRPGQHFFIVAPGISKLPWEAHPFTAASIPSSKSTNGAPNNDMEISFIIRGRDGFTGNLLRYALEHESMAHVPVPGKFLVDGPYGQPPDLGIFDTAILVAGGSGVSYTLAMLLSRIQQAKEGKGRTSRVLFIWIIRDASHIQWISSALQAAFDSEPNTGRPLNVEIRIFITQSESTISAPPGSASTEERHQQSFPMSNNVNRMRMVIDSNDDLIQVVRGGGGTIDFNFGRPEVGKLIEEELAASDGLKVSVDVSGPGPLADNVKGVLARSSLASPAATLRGGPDVSLHTETFG